VDAERAIALLLADPQAVAVLTDTRRPTLAARIVDTGWRAEESDRECDRFAKLEID
jgi:hypothetical protein